MPPKRRSFGRPLATKSYNKLFVLAVEGEKTEPEYFALFKKVGVKCLPGKKKTSCTQVLKRLKHFLEKENVREPYEAWLVIDKDDNNEEKLQESYKWSQLKEQYNLALSNPNFEYWLLLHFEDGTNIHSVRECSDHLKRYLPDYNKGIDERKITVDAINKAIIHAKQRDNLSCLDGPKDIYGTTVYKLVEKLLSLECF